MSPLTICRSFYALGALLLLLSTTAHAYWLADIPHQGRSAYHRTPNTYKVFRNVRDYGARGDGVTDDTAAINRAISDGGRCAPHVCGGETTSPAVVYFPSGTYVISNSIIDYYYTQLVGDPTKLPVIKASANFPTETTFGLLDGNQYGANGLAWKAVNVFFRQVRNLVIDTTAIPAGKNAVGIHWPSSQATALSNVQFRLSAAAGTRHVGLFIEEGSGGLLSDLTFVGGNPAAKLGNQQYTARNLIFSNAPVAIEQLWDWGWTYKGLRVTDCSVGIKINDVETGSLTLIDSYFKNVRTAVFSVRDRAGSGNAARPNAGSYVMHNTIFEKVTDFLAGPKGTIEPGKPNGVFAHKGFAMGRAYTPTGPVDQFGNQATNFDGALRVITGSKYYDRSKPQYESLPASKVLRARAFGARGDGTNDDTAALQALLNAAARDTSTLAFIDAGTYIVTNTLYVAPGVRLAGEALASIIMATGSKFASMSSPTPVVRVGRAGETGYVEWSDTIVSTRGPCPGAVLIEWNLNTPADRTPSGMWDVHTRIGGFAGTQLQLTQCAKAPGQTNSVRPQCVAAHTSMRVTRSAAGLLMENCWMWVADHDIEDPDVRQVTVYAARGMLIESRDGRVWMHGVGSEHHTLYQFQLLDTQRVVMVQPQTETPYYQPNPPASTPFPLVAALADPDFSACQDLRGAPCRMAWGMRIVSSRDVVVFGAGLYSFFNNNSDACAQQSSPTDCQARMLEVVDRPGAAVSSNVLLYNLNTVGSAGMVRRLGVDVAFAQGNSAGFADNICLYRH